MEEAPVDGDPTRNHGARPGTSERDRLSRREVDVPDGDGVHVPVVLVGAAAWSWRILVVFGVLAGVGLLVSRLTLLVVAFATAMLTTALLMPVTHWLRNRGVSRGISTLLTILLAGIVLGGVGYFVVDRAIAGYSDLADQTSQAVKNIQNGLTNGPFHLDSSSVNNIGDTITRNLSNNKGAITSGVISAGRTAIDVLTGVVLWLFLTIFLVYDGDRVWEWVVRLLPRRGEELARGAGHRAWRTLTGYVGGQFLVALFHATAISVTLLILRAPLVAPLALVVFIFSFVPIIGALVAGAFAVVVVLVADGPVQAAVLVTVLIVEDQIESHVLQPLVVGRYVRLHPIAIAVTLTGGALLAGLPGAIFGVPIVATVNAAVKFLSGREDIDGNTIPRDEIVDDPLADALGDPPGGPRPAVPGGHGHGPEVDSAGAPKNAPADDPDPAQPPDRAVPDRSEPGSARARQHEQAT